MTGGYPPQAPAPPAAEVEYGDWRRLNARMLIVRPLHELVGLLPAVIVVLFTGDGDTWRLVLGAAVAALLLVRSVLVWSTTSYRVTEEYVERHEGLFSRNTRSVRRDRIRTVEANARFGHRLFGLAEVRIGSGEHEQRGGKGAFTLDAVTAAEAERLRIALLRRKSSPTAGESTVDAPAAGTSLAELDRGWLRYAPLTLSGLAAVGALFALGARTVQELDIEPSRIALFRDGLDFLDSGPPPLVVALVILAVLVVSTIGSLAGYLLAYWNYRLTREPDGTLRVRRGLLTNRSVSIEEARLRGVVLHEPLLVRAARGGKLTAVSAGLGVHGERNRRGEANLLLPVAPVAEAHRIAALALRTEGSPVAGGLRGHPRAALRRRLVRAVVPVLLLGTGLAVFLAWQWVFLLAAVIPAVFLGYDRYRSLGHALHGDYLITRAGSLRRSTAAVRRDGVIGWQIERSFFQRRAGLATITAITSAGEFEIVDVGVGTGVAFAAEAVPGLLSRFLAGPAVERHGLVTSTHQGASRPPVPVYERSKLSP